MVADRRHNTQQTKAASRSLALERMSVTSKTEET
jgi:hypothetical protein